MPEKHVLRILFDCAVRLNAHVHISFTFQGVYILKKLINKNPQDLVLTFSPNSLTVASRKLCSGNVSCAADLFSMTRHHIEFSANGTALASTQKKFQKDLVKIGFHF